MKYMIKERIKSICDQLNDRHSRPEYIKSESDFYDHLKKISKYTSKYYRTNK